MGPYIVVRGGGGGNGAQVYRALDGPIERLRGLLGTGPDAHQVALLDCRSVHTFGMRYRLDIAFVDEQQAAGFDWIPIQDAPLVAVVPLTHPERGPIRLETLLGGTFITAPEQYIETIIAPDAGTRRFKIDAADDASIISMVETGMGVSVLCTLSLQGYAHRVRTLPLQPPMHCRFGLMVKSRSSAPQSARDLIQYAQTLTFDLP